MLNNNGADATVNNQQQNFIAFDFGTKRTGVAFGNVLLGTARGLPTIQAPASGDARWLKIGKILKEWQPDAIVIGVPYHPDGASHDNTKLAQQFGRQLHGRFGLQVFEIDERYSTTEALQNHGNRNTSIVNCGSSQKFDVDASSACIILEQFFRTLPQIPTL